MREHYVEAVLAVAELIPAGQVLSYGDIAVLLAKGGPRQVGAVMSAHGSRAPWWRVIRASGAAPTCHSGRALAHYLLEQTALHGDTATAVPTAGIAPSWRVDMRQARWNPGDADLDRIDAIAAELQAAYGGVDTVRGVKTAPASMSVPHDGLGA